MTWKWKGDIKYDVKGKCEVREYVLETFLHPIFVHCLHNHLGGESFISMKFIRFQNLETAHLYIYLKQSFKVGLCVKHTIRPNSPEFPNSYEDDSPRSRMLDWQIQHKSNVTLFMLVGEHVLSSSGTWLDYI